MIKWLKSLNPDQIKIKSISSIIALTQVLSFEMAPEAYLINDLKIHGKYENYEAEVLCLGIYYASNQHDSP